MSTKVFTFRKVVGTTKENLKAHFEFDIHYIETCLKWIFKDILQSNYFSLSTKRNRLYLTQEI